MSNYGPKKPLHIQNPDLVKAHPKNPSWESFREHRIHPNDYQYQGMDRPNTHMMSIIRRYPNGELDYEWATNMVLDAINNQAYPHANLPIHNALTTVVFPERFRNMEPMQADLMTQFSDSEKSRVKAMVEERLLEMENYNAGRGGGSVDGRGKTRDGVP